MGGSIELQGTLDDIGKAVATGTEYEVGEGWSEVCCAPVTGGGRRVVTTPQPDLRLCSSTQWPLGPELASFEDCARWGAPEFVRSICSTSNTVRITGVSDPRGGGGE